VQNQKSVSIPGFSPDETAFTSEPLARNKKTLREDQIRLWFTLLKWNISIDRKYLVIARELTQTNFGYSESASGTVSRRLSCRDGILVPAITKLSLSPVLPAIHKRH
jgi:hypothetical protein